MHNSNKKLGSLALLDSQIENVFLSIWLPHLMPSCIQSLPERLRKF